MSKLLHKELTGKIIGVYYTAYTRLSQTYPEYIYEQAMMTLLKREGIHCMQQENYEVRYKERLVGRQTLGPGFIHRIYANACYHELKLRGIAVTPHREIRVFLDTVELGRVKFGHLQVDNRALIFPITVSNIENINFENLKVWMRYLNIPIGVVVNFKATWLEPVILRA